MAEKEAKARIKINRLLEEAGWRFFDAPEGKANVLLENSARLTASWLDAHRELIALFEKKIQATLARVWGEDEPAPGKV